MKKPRCIIFGGGGFIGSHLVEALVKKKHPVVVFTYGSKQEYQNLKNVISKIELIKGNFNNNTLVNKVLKSDDVVFDLVASSVPSSSFMSPVDEINNHIYPHVKLIETSFQKKVKKFIFLSSGGGVYGEQKIIPVSEIQITQPISPHAIAKLTIEYYLQYFSQVYRSPILIYRVSNAYGPRQTPKKGFGIIPTMFFNIINNQKPVLFNNGKIIRDFIYIDDITDAITTSFDKKNKFNVYNLGSGKGTSLIRLYEKLIDMTKSNFEPVYKPKRSFDVEKNVLDITRFSDEYHWIPKVNLQSGLQNTWDWLKKIN